MYDLLVQLTGDSVRKLLKNSNSNAFKSESFDHLSTSPAIGGGGGGGGGGSVSGDRRPSEVVQNPKNPLKDVLQHRKRNQKFRQLFRLPQDEEVMDEINVCFMFDYEPGFIPVEAAKLVGRKTYQGTLYQSQNYLVFQSDEVSSMTEFGKSSYSIILPLYTLTKFERINSDTYKSLLSFRTWHKMVCVFKVDVSEWKYGAYVCRGERLILSLRLKRQLAKSFVIR